MSGAVVRRLEKLTNIAVLITCVVLVASLGHNFYLSHTMAAATSGIKHGQQIELPGYSPTGAGPTLVMALSTRCHFCTASMPFYKKLTVFRRSTPGSLRVVAVLPESEGEAKAYLQQNGIAVDRVLPLPLEQIGVSGTPTLLLLDRQNKVDESWVGLLDEAQQAKVIETLEKSCAGCILPAATGRSTIGAFSALTSYRAYQGG